MEDIIIKDLKSILNAKNVKVIERLLGGMSNYTYVVEADEILYTFRIPGEYSEHFVNRVEEKENIKIVETLNITNETIYLNTIDGKKIAKYISGTPLSMVEEKNYPYDLVSGILKTIHNSDLYAVSEYKPFTRLDYYEKIVTDLKFVHPEEYLKQKEIFFKYKEFLENTPKVLTHGDSQPSNFVLTKDGIMVVDFEFCANNDPIYDIACFSNKRYEDGLKLLNIYYQNPTDDQIFRFHLWRAFQCFQWYNVAMFKDMVGMSKSLKLDFNKIAEHYLEMIVFLLKKVKE